MIHRLGVAAFYLAALVAALLAAMACVMLLNGVPDARGGAGVLGFFAALVLLAGAGLRFVFGWRR